MAPPAGDAAHLWTMHTRAYSGMLTGMRTGTSHGTASAR